MARLTSNLSVETDVMSDALAELQEVHSRLAKRHGDSFRKLDRAIEQLLETSEDIVEVHWLGDGKVLVSPTGRFTEILREARRLGVVN
ncbi:hypothetical protein [Sinorhizobium fredii]|uniref:hypothetical protein n=1 Tax=Rhizobium fredii TaxID=380 RepID=UPI0004B6D1D0|nr:hypothetical protein [Sinorhizobium fredii]